MMLTPWNISCEANNLRGQLKHSWLENQLCNKKTEDILYLWRKGEWRALETEFDIRVKETSGLADNLAEGFSPAQLVDQLRSLAHLSESDRSSIKKAVHQAYLKSSGILGLQTPLKEAANSIGDALSQLRNSWIEKAPEEEVKVKKAWEQVAKKANELLEIFKKLPTGVVFP